MVCPRCGHKDNAAARLYCVECGMRLLRGVSLSSFATRTSGQTGAIMGNRYKIHGFVGKGATSRVYLAEDLLLNRPVAVKMLASTSATGPSPAAKERFFREAKAAMSIDHPNVIKFLDVAEQPDGTPYLVLEVLRGETLGEYMRREGGMAVDLALVMLRQAAAGLAAAHRAGVVHRDIKPDNLFLVGDIGTPFAVKVIDFGLAKVQQRNGLSIAGVVLGTMEYMAPEQVLTEPADPRTDVYGLGAVMFRVITGQFPFTAKDAVELLAQQLHTPPPPPTWIDEDLDPDVEKVILTALRKNPDNRYASMDALLEDIERLLGMREGRPGSAPLAHDPDRYEPRTAIGKSAAKILKAKIEA